MPKVIDLPTSTSMTDSDYLIMEASGGGTKKITKSKAMTPTVVTATNSSALTLEDSTAVDVASLSITSGTWVISGQVLVSGGGSTGKLVAFIQTASQSTNWQAGRAASTAINTTTYVGVSVSRIITVASTTTIYLVGYQTSGAAKSSAASSCHLDAVKIG